MIFTRYSHSLGSACTGDLYRDCGTTVATIDGKRILDGDRRRGEFGPGYFQPYVLRAHDHTIFSRDGSGLAKIVAFTSPYALYTVPSREFEEI
jgi:hypothetical protein